MSNTRIYKFSSSTNDSQFSILMSQSIPVSTVPWIRSHHEQKHLIQQKYCTHRIGLPLISRNRSCNSLNTRRTLSRFTITTLEEILNSLEKRCFWNNGLAGQVFTQDLAASSISFSLRALLYTLDPQMATASGKLSIIEHIELAHCEGFIGSWVR